MRHGLWITLPEYQRFSTLEDFKGGGVHPLVPGDDDSAAPLRRTAVPGRDEAAGAIDDRDQRDDVVRLQFGFDDQVDLPGGQHAIGIAIAAVARELHLVLV